MRNRLRVVLNTNILLVYISSKSKYHWVFSNLLNNAYELYVTNEVLLEYEEIISSKYNEEVAKNVILVTPFFKWDLMG